MSNEIDVSDRGSLQRGGGTKAWRALRLILAQVAADSSSAIAFRRTASDTTLRCEVDGCWYEMVPPRPEVVRALLRMLKEKAGLATGASWGEGEILLRTEEGLMTFRLLVSVDPQGRELVILYRVSGPGPGVEPMRARGERES
jgi:hypothetical protein